MASSTAIVDLSESRGTEVNVIAWVFTGIAMATVFLKLFVRAQTDVKRLGWDDFFIFFALVSISKICRKRKSWRILTLSLKGHEHHCCSIRIILGDPWPRPTHSCSNCRLWYWKIGPNCEMADIRIS